MVRPADGFTRGAGVAGCHGVGRQEARTAAGGQRIGIGVPVGLACRVRRPRRGLRIDREVGSGIGDRVVAQYGSRAQGGRDGIESAQHGFARGAGVGGGYTVSRQEARTAAGGQRIGIGVAIGLACRIRRPRGGLRVDGERR